MGLQLENLNDPGAKGISYTAGFFMLIGFAVAGLLFSGAVGIPIWTAVTGRSADTFMDVSGTRADTQAVRLIMLISALIAFLAPALLTASVLNRKPMKLLGFTGSVSARQVVAVLGIAVSALFVSGFLGWLNEVIPIPEHLRIRFEALEQEYNRQVVAILGLSNFTDYLVGLLVMAVLPAVCEEALFRGGLQNFLSRATARPWLAIIVVSLIFSVAHFSFFGFLPRFVLGIMLGALFHFSGRLWLPVLAHFLNNALAVTILYVYKLQEKELEEAVSGTASGWQGVFAVPLLIALLYVFYRISRPPAEQPKAVPASEAAKNSHGL